jgi:TonB-linked SusC/RagA family outer membrane protein
MIVFLSLTTSSGWAQDRTITGKVMDIEDRFGLPGVSILVKGTSSGTTTDFDGNYSIVVGDGAVLVYSMVGYVEQEITVGAQSVIDVMMNLDIKELSEVIVIGYGTVEKGDVTGVVTKVDAEKFNKGAIATPDQLLSGKVAGVNISNSGGEPGAGFNINIRGATSINASSRPLIVLDGVPLSEDGMPGSRSPLAFLNPAEIESMTVLKDASASAIYGSRAANGVIIITTKTGKAGDKPTVTYDGNVGVGQFTKELPVLTPDEFRAVLTTFAPGKVDQLGDANTVWVDEILRNARNQQHNLSISGGIENGGYRLSAGYQQIQGVIYGSETERTDINFNFNKSLFNDDLKVRYSSKNGFVQNSFGSNQVGNALFFDPTQPIYSGVDNYGGYFEWVDDDGDKIPLTASNPVAENRERINVGKELRSLNNLEMSYRLPFLPELKFTVNTSIDVRNSSNNQFTPTYLASEVGDAPGYYRAESGERQELLFESYGEYTKKFGDLEFLIMGGYSYQQGTSQFIHFTVDSLENNLFGIDAPSIGQGTIFNPIPVNFQDENRIISFYGRTNLEWQDKYIITGTLRRDGSTRFGPENRWGLFPSFAASWRLSNESFLADVSGVLNYLKLRVGWGITGNQQFDNYRWLEQYELGSPDAAYQLGNQYYLTVRPLGVDPNIKWEETATLNIGLDYELFKGKITGAFEVYQKNTDDLLFNSVFPAGSITRDKAITNIGEMVNKGIEMEIGSEIVRTQDLNISVNFNAGYNQNEILNLDAQSIPQGETPPIFEVGNIAGDVGQTIQVLQVGQTINSFYAYEHIYEGDVPVFSPLSATNMYVDQNKDGLINENDLVVLGQPMPDWIFGLTTVGGWKGFDWSLTLRGMTGNTVYNNVASNNGHFGNFNWTVASNLHTSVLDTRFPARQLKSDYYLEDGAFLRLDNVSVGYTFSQLDWSNIRVYFTGQNLYVLTGYTGLDPEVQPDGIDNNLYPRPVTLIGGLTVTF